MSNKQKKLIAGHKTKIKTNTSLNEKFKFAAADMNRKKSMMKKCMMFLIQYVKDLVIKYYLQTLIFRFVKKCIMAVTVTIK